MYYLIEGDIIFIVNLFVNRSMPILGKNQKIGLGLTWIPLNFEGDLNHRLDIKNNLDFPTYLLLHGFAQVCNPRVFLLILSSRQDMKLYEYNK